MATKGTIAKSGRLYPTCACCQRSDATVAYRGTQEYARLRAQFLCQFCWDDPTDSFLHCKHGLPSKETK